MIQRCRSRLLNQLGGGAAVVMRVDEVPRVHPLDASSKAANTSPTSRVACSCWRRRTPCPPSLAPSARTLARSAISGGSSRLSPSMISFDCLRRRMCVSHSCRPNTTGRVTRRAVALCAPRSAKPLGGPTSTDRGPTVDDAAVWVIPPFSGPPCRVAFPPPVRAHRVAAERVLGERERTPEPAFGTERAGSGQHGCPPGAVLPAAGM